MGGETARESSWQARGLLFENCSCQAVCPGHVHFDQLCTHDRCLGYWAMRVDEGRWRDVSLDGLTAVVAYDTPRHMIEGDWTERLVIDAAASSAQRQALETILMGRAGGPWAVLARFTGRWLETLYRPVRIVSTADSRAVSIEGLLDARIAAIRGRDRSRRVTFENMFNQIHAPSQVIATGETTYDDGTIVVRNDGTHALWSQFDWSVSGD
ncbi:MAG: DUF1326 domain-containing protein [Acidobacteriota bacterium]